MGGAFSSRIHYGCPHRWIAGDLRAISVDKVCWLPYCMEFVWCCCQVVQGAGAGRGSKVQCMRVDFRSMGILF